MASAQFEATAHAAVDENIDRWKAELVARVRRQVPVNALADSDLEHCYFEAFTELFLALREGKTVANFKGYVFRVTVNKAINAARRNQTGKQTDPEALTEIPSSLDDIEVSIEDLDTVRRFEEAGYTLLTEREHQVIRLTVLGGYSHANVAATLGITKRAVRRALESDSRKNPGRKKSISAMARMGGFFERIGDGKYCETQEALIRAYAFHQLDKDSREYKAARLHLDAHPPTGIEHAPPRIRLPRAGSGRMENPPRTSVQPQYPPPAKHDEPF